MSLNTQPITPLRHEGFYPAACTFIRLSILRLTNRSSSCMKRSAISSLVYWCRDSVMKPENLWNSGTYSSGMFTSTSASTLKSYRLKIGSKYWRNSSASLSLKLSFIKDCFIPLEYTAQLESSGGGKLIISVIYFSLCGLSVKVPSITHELLCWAGINAESVPLHARNPSFGAVV
jgi:hypothetical protein